MFESTKRFKPAKTENYETKPDLEYLDNKIFRVFEQDIILESEKQIQSIYLKF